MKRFGTARAARFIVLLLSVCLLLGQGGSPVFAASQRFSDVPPTKWYYGYVENMAQRDIVNGFGQTGQFRPDNQVERQHAAKMITLAADLDYIGKKANFVDVDPNGSMSPFIKALQEIGAIGGYPDQTFRPTNPVKRGEIAKIITEAMGLELFGSAPSFRDTASHWSKGYVQILTSNGIVKGYADGTFRPDSPVTRAELCKILSIAMAVEALQIAENDPRISTMYAAQELIDSLPAGQDIETTNALYERLYQLFGGYAIRLIKEKEPNGSFANANRIPVLARDFAYYRLFGTITDTIWDEDYYKFTLSRNGLIEVVAWWASEEIHNQWLEDDLRILLYDASGNIIAESYYATSGDPSSGTFAYLCEDLPAGTYYLRADTYVLDDLYIDKYYAIDLDIYFNLP